MAPPKRLYTNRRIFFLIRSHCAAGARSRADTARLHPRRRRRPLPPRRRSLGGDVHISRSCCCFSSRSRCCSALALGPLPGLLLLTLLLLLLLLLALLLSLLLLLVLLLYSCARCCCTSSRSGSPLSPYNCYLRCCGMTSCPGSRTRCCCYCFLILVRLVSRVKFNFDNKIEFRQLNSVSTVKFRDEQLVYFTSSTLLLCILRHLLEMLLEFHSG